MVFALAFVVYIFFGVLNTIGWEYFSRRVFDLQPLDPTDTEDVAMVMAWLILMWPMSFPTGMLILVTRWTLLIVQNICGGTSAKEGEQ